MTVVAQRKKAISEINKAGALLVFPVNNRKEPASLWSRFYPRSRMNWEWDDDGDDRVAKMWRLMKELSDCREVVYSKWFQGRATFFSRELFTALLKITGAAAGPGDVLSSTARQALDVLEMDSPISTKELKKQLELQGKHYEAIYNKAMKQLFSKFLIVGFGEVDDGAFPSLAIAATRLVYEDLWSEAAGLSKEDATTVVEKFMPEGSAFRRQLEKIRQTGPSSVNSLDLASR